MIDKTDEMNVFQKTATLIARLVGCAIAAVGVIGPAWVIALKILGAYNGHVPVGGWAASLAWVVGGIGLILISKPIGRWIGSGLD